MNAVSHEVNDWMGLLVCHAKPAYNCPAAALCPWSSSFTHTKQRLL